jgi:hypothetical protein
VASVTDSHPTTSRVAFAMVVILSKSASSRQGRRIRPSGKLLSSALSKIGSLHVDPRRVEACANEASDESPLVAIGEP